MADILDENEFDDKGSVVELFGIKNKKKIYLEFFYNKILIKINKTL